MSEKTFKKGSKPVPGLAWYSGSSRKIAYIDNLLSIIKFNYQNMQKKQQISAFALKISDLC